MIAESIKGSNAARILGHITQPVRALARSQVFFLKVLPMLPSRPVDWLTSPPLRERVTFAVPFGQGFGDLYRPSRPGPHPGMVVCLGVLPYGYDHPQVPRLGAALARSGFAALLYRSSAMDDLRLAPEDVGNVAAAFQYLSEQPYVAGRRTGLIGTCVGGAFALLAAAHPAIRDKVAFVGAFAPYASMKSLALQIACSTCVDHGAWKPWQVDQLTRRVFVHSLTAHLAPREAEQMRALFDQSPGPRAVQGLSPDAQALGALLTAPDLGQARAALRRLPPALLADMEAMSPIRHLQDIHAPVITFGHDRDDLVIPVGESRRLRDAMASRRGVRYTEFGMFQHADPTKRKLPRHRLAWELSKFYRFVYPLFREAVR
jgi:hypothetical protein